MKDNTVYKRIRGYLGDNYQNSDDELINLYCSTLEYFETVREAIKKDGIMQVYTNTAGASNMQKHPLTNEISKSGQLLSNLLKGLGLTASQRKAVLPEVDDGFDEF